MTSQMCPNEVVYFGGGASWGTCGAIIRNMYPKVLQKWSQACKNASKRAPEMVKVSPKYWRILENDTSLTKPGLQIEAKRVAHAE